MAKFDKKLNGDQPATQADLATLAGEMSSRFDLVDQRLGRLESDVATIKTHVGDLKRGQDGMKKLLEENNRLLKEFRSLPARVERLERTVFPRR